MMTCRCRLVWYTSPKAFHLLKGKAGSLGKFSTGEPHLVNYNVSKREVFILYELIGVSFVTIRWQVTGTYSSVYNKHEHL